MAHEPVASGSGVRRPREALALFDINDFSTPVPINLGARAISFATARKTIHFSPSLLGSTPTAFPRHSWRGHIEAR